MNYKDKLDLISFHVSRLVIWLHACPPTSKEMIRLHVRLLSYLTENNHADYCITIRNILHSEWLSRDSGINILDEISDYTLKLCEILGYTSVIKRVDEQKAERLSKGK